MWYQILRIIPLFAFIFLFSGCSSLAGNERDRALKLQGYLNQTEPLVLYTSSSLQSDEQLRLFGMSSQVKPLIQDFPSEFAVLGLVERFIAQAAIKRESAVRLIEPGQWGDIKRAMDTPVLFVYGDWHLVYQRLPPNMQRFRLQAGVIAKVIPLGQVLSGRGTIALRTASWESRCLHDALGGRHFSVAEWRDNGSRRLQLAVSEVQEVCADKLAKEFSLNVGHQR